jgi:uncharacterized protein YbaR (Trm112 family)
MVLPETLLKILVCPVDKAWLMYFADEDLLYNPRLRRAYWIEEGVPVMLPERAEPVPEREHERLITRARDGAAVLSATAGPPPGGGMSGPYPVTASGGTAGPVDGRSTPT